MSKTPTPDEYGRYRVRRKGDTSAPAYSTPRFDPARHVIMPGPASDIYGAALPPKPSRRLAVSEEPPAGGATTNDPPAGGEENENDE